MNLTFTNDSSTPKAGYNPPSGSHLINLVNKTWNHCFLEIDEYQRDKVMAISFDTALKGKDRTTGDSAVYYIDNLQLQQIKNPEQVSGWSPAEHTIAYSTTGYETGERKTAIVNTGLCGQWKHFQLINAANNQVAHEGSLERQQTTIGEFGVIDFTAFNQPGDYQLKVGDIMTSPFRIGENVWDNSLWRVLNFLFCQRCGHPVPGKHAACHTDLFPGMTEKYLLLGRMARCRRLVATDLTNRRCDFLLIGSLQPPQRNQCPTGCTFTGGSRMGS